MEVTVQIDDYSKPAQPRMKIHNAWHDGDKVEIEIDDKRYTVCADELISAVNKCKLNFRGI